MERIFFSGGYDKKSPRADPSGRARETRADAKEARRRGAVRSQTVRGGAFPAEGRAIALEERRLERWRHHGRRHRSGGERVVGGGVGVVGAAEERARRSANLGLGRHTQLLRLAASRSAMLLLLALGVPQRPLAALEADLADFEAVLERSGQQKQEPPEPIYVSVDVRICSAIPKLERTFAHCKFVAEHRIERNGAGRYWLKDGADDKGRKSSLDEFKAMCSHLNIQANNPCVLLTQEHAKKFLHHGNEETRYKFFLSAANMDSRKQHLLETMQNCTLLETRLGRAQDGMADKKEHADKWNFGQSPFGGRFIPETLMVAHKELEAAWNKWKVDPAFKAELATLRRDFIGGPTPLYHAKSLSEACGGDIKYVMPLTSSLKKDVVAKSLLPRVVGVDVDAFREVLDRLTATTPAKPLTATEILIALHDVDPVRHGVPLKKIIDACGECFNRPDVFTPEVVAAALQKMVEATPLPLLFMRSVIQAEQAAPSLREFTLGLLRTLTRRQVWKMDGKIWEGFCRCAKRATPRSFPVMIDLPPKALEELLNKARSISTLVPIPYTASAPVVNAVP